MTRTNGDDDFDLRISEQEQRILARLLDDSLGHASTRWQDRLRAAHPAFFKSAPALPDRWQDVTLEARRRKRESEREAA